VFFLYFPDANYFKLMMRMYFPETYFGVIFFPEIREYIFFPEWLSGNVFSGNIHFLECVSGNLCVFYFCIICIFRKHILIILFPETYIHFLEYFRRPECFVFTRLICIFRKLLYLFTPKVFL